MSSGPLKGIDLKKIQSDANKQLEQDQLSKPEKIPTASQAEASQAAPVRLSPESLTARNVIRSAARGGDLPSNEVEAKRRQLKKLSRELGILAKILEDPLVSDIFRNPDGTLWRNRLGDGTTPIDYVMSDDTALSLIGTVADFMGLHLSPTTPVVEGVLPSDKSRFTAAIPPISNGGPFFAIRKRAVLQRSFFDYIDSGIMTNEQAAFIRKRIKAGDNFLIVGSTGSGKALPLDAKILTPSGYKKMGDLTLGDKVIGQNGLPTTITGIFPQGDKQAWKITFSDGTHTISCDEHLWAVRTRAQKAKHQDYAVHSLKALRDNLHFASDGKPRWYIPMVEPIQLRGKKVSIDPYILGTLLGNGLLDGSDPHGSKEGGGAVKGRSKSNSTKQLHPFNDRLKRLKLFNSSNKDVFIPTNYLYNDFKTRLSLFQGILDSSGWIQNKQSHIEIATYSEQLAQDLSFLVHSFGGIVRFGKRNKERIRIYISLPGSIEPTRIKKDRYSPPTQRQPVRAIQSIEMMNVVPMQCISVGAKDGLFVVESCIVTHNTTFGNAVLKEMAEMSTPDERFIIIEDTAELQCMAENKVEMLVSPGVKSMNDLLKLTMRLSPTRICIGELRGEEAHTLIKAWNTGHKGGLTTIHSDSVLNALDRLEDLIKEGGIAPSKRKIANSVNCIVVIEKDRSHKRRISQILRLTSGDDHQYYTTDK